MTDDWPDTIEGAQTHVYRLVGYAGQPHGFFNREPCLSQTIAEIDQFLTDLGWLEPVDG